jgi:membrane associated rhomboid family serine protease
MCSVRFFACANYRTALLCTVAGNAGIYAAWQIEDQRFMKHHFALSWEGIAERKRFWTIWTSHFSHCRLEHLAENLLAFVSLGFVLQKILPPIWLGAHLLFVPFVASSTSLANVFVSYGPEEAKSLCKQYPALDWGSFCYYRYLELRSGATNNLTSRLCGLEELGIKLETTKSEIVRLFQPYQRWYEQSTQCKLGMSAITLSLQGFAASWFMHLGASGMWNPIVAIGLGLLTCQPAMDLASLYTSRSSEQFDIQRFGMGSGVDIAGHLSGFAFGALSYLARYRAVGKLITPAFAKW